MYLQSSRVKYGSITYIIKTFYYMSCTWSEWSHSPRIKKVLLSVLKIYGPVLEWRKLAVLTALISLWQENCLKIYVWHRCTVFVVLLLQGGVDNLSVGMFYVIKALPYVYWGKLYSCNIILAAAKQCNCSYKIFCSWVIQGGLPVFEPISKAYNWKTIWNINTQFEVFVFNLLQVCLQKPVRNATSGCTGNENVSLHCRDNCVILNCTPCKIWNC